MEALLSRPIEVILIVIATVIVFYALKAKGFPLNISVTAAIALLIIAALARAYIFPPTVDSICNTNRSSLLGDYREAFDSNDRKLMHAWMGRASAWASKCSSKANDIDIRFQNPAKFCKDNSSEEVCFKEPMQIIKSLIEGEAL